MVLPSSIPISNILEIGIPYERAKAVCNKYVRDGSEREVNISYTARNDVLIAFDKGDLSNPPSPVDYATRFDKAATEVQHLLKDSYQRFRGTPEYGKFVADYHSRSRRLKRRVSRSFKTMTKDLSRSADPPSGANLNRQKSSPALRSFARESRVSGKLNVHNIFTDGMGSPRSCPVTPVDMPPRPTPLPNYSSIGSLRTYSKPLRGRSGSKTPDGRRQKSFHAMINDGRGFVRNLERNLSEDEPEEKETDKEEEAEPASSASDLSTDSPTPANDSLILNFQISPPIAPTTANLAIHDTIQLGVMPRSVTPPRKKDEDVTDIDTNASVKVGSFGKDSVKL